MHEEPAFYQYLILAGLLLFSAFFSGSETAIFSLNRLERNALLKTKSRNLRGVLSTIITHQDKLLVTILTGNMVVNIFASSLGELIGAKLFAGKSQLLSIIVITLLLLLIGELTPKRFAVTHAKGFTQLAAYPLLAFHYFFTPLRVVFNWISRKIIGIFPGSQIRLKEHKHALVLSAAELGFNQDILKHSEYKLFKSYLQFKEKNANAVMTPRNELKTVARETPIAQVLELLNSEPDYLVNSSLILYEEDIDHLYGWVPAGRIIQSKLSAKDLDRPISALSNEFHIVPESKQLPELIPELRENSIEAVLLVDEYGGTAGVLWFRNIIEDVLRAFYAPYKEKFNACADTAITIDGSMPVDEFKEFFECRVETEAETVAGLFLDLHGDIPKIGTTVRLKEIELKVIALDTNKIERILVTETPENQDQ